jgi:hypothetical protein
MSPSRMAPVAPSVQEATTPATHVLRAKGSIQVRTQNMAEGRLGGRTQGIGSRQYHLKVGCPRTCWSLPHSHRRAIHHPFCSCCRRPLCPAATICRTRLNYLNGGEPERWVSCAIFPHGRCRPHQIQPLQGVKLGARAAAYNGAESDDKACID